MILISFGDEHCHGEKAPKMIAKENQLSFVDNAIPVTTNLSIFKDVVHTVVSIKKPKNYIFLIGWTTSKNIQYRYENKNIVFTKEKYNHEMARYNKLNKFNNYLFEPVLINQQRLALVHATQQLLESKNIKYYMYNISEKIDYNNYTAKGLKNINNKNYHNALSFDSTMLGYIKKQKLDYKAGQVAWAKFISQKMRAAGVLEK